MELSSEDASPISIVIDTNSQSLLGTGTYQKSKTSKNDSFKTKLENFDQTFDTLIDYFAIIGYDE